MAEFQVERYFSHENIHPALIALGRSHQVAARPGFRQHSHNVTEICLLHGGSIRYLTDAEHYTIPANATHISQPGQWHGTPDGRLDPCTLSWLQVDMTLLKAPKLTRSVTQLPLILENSANNAIPHFDAMLAELRNPQDDSLIAIDGHLRLLLLSLVRYAKTNEASALPPLLSDALHYIDNHDTLEPRVTEMAQALQVHRSYLHTLFVKHLGITPQAYIKGMHLKRAADRLSETQDSITRISASLGFATTQHFATAFRKRYGVSPSEFRKQAFM